MLVQNVTLFMALLVQNLTPFRGPAGAESDFLGVLPVQNLTLFKGPAGVESKSV